FYNLQRAEPCAKRVNEILNADEKIIQAKDAVVLEKFERNISFKNVSFSYGDEAQVVLKNINLNIQKGETIALVGASGAGKSTLMDLIPRFADCTHGNLFVDDQDIKLLDINSVRRKIGYVGQQAILFNDTIFNNIAFGMPDATQQDVEAAARAANAHDFIMKTENAYQTKLSDRGMSLSGGERQRICIARELLKNPEILLLDEATSALDTQSEHAVQKAIDELSKNKTCIIIAHRLSTITKADRIVLLESGQITEEGTYEELLSLNKGFAGLVKMQTL
ncbi:MAG: ATP-binding cassette domain-containing protein, partial [Bacteroidales bacterium]|nr:ATP-binding cassette domain-containing protein [Bacteroidales bacterium]